MTVPIPYGMGGIIPGSMGGTPNLAGINAGITSTFANGGGIGGGIPGGNLAELVNQLHLTPSGAFSPYPKVASGWAGNSLLEGLTPSIPNGASSAFPRAVAGGIGEIPGLAGFNPSIPAGAASRFPLSEVPVAIRGRLGNVAGEIGGAATAGEEALLGNAGKGFMSRIASRLPMAEGVGLKGFAKGAVGPLIASIALNKAAGMAGGDESFLGRALKGAGTGAIGFALGPEVGIPATIAGALLSGLKGKPKDGTPVWLQNEVLDRAGFSGEDKAQIQMTYDILKETQGKKAADAAIGQLIMQDITNRQQQKQQDESSQRRMLATQALAAQFFQPFTKQMMDSAQQRYSISESLAKDLPPEYRSMMRAQNAASLDNANRVATSYAAQAQLLPMMATVDYQRNLADQLAQQNAAAVIQGMAGGGSSTGSLTDLASQLGLQTSQAGG